MAWDRWDGPRGDASASRYERILTDPAVEPRKKNWDVEVAIKISKGKVRQRLQPPAEACS